MSCNMCAPHHASSIFSVYFYIGFAGYPTSAPVTPAPGTESLDQAFEQLSLRPTTGTPSPAPFTPMIGAGGHHQSPCTIGTTTPSGLFIPNYHQNSFVAPTNTIQVNTGANQQQRVNFPGNFVHSGGATQRQMPNAMMNGVAQQSAPAPSKSGRGDVRGPPFTGWMPKVRNWCYTCLLTCVGV